MFKSYKNPWIRWVAVFFALPILLFCTPALSANAEVGRYEGNLKSYPVADNVHIYKGAHVCIDASGYLNPAADTAGFRYAGVAAEECDNTLTGHAAGGKECRVWTGGEFQATFTSITQAMVGQMMYIKDDATLDDTSTNLVPAGILVEYISATSGKFRIDAPVGEQAIVINSPAVVNRGGDVDWASATAGLSLAKAKSAKVAYVPIVGLQVGDVISAYQVNAGLGGGSGKATTLDCALYSSVAKAGGTTDTDIGAITQVKAEADTLVASTKTLAAASTVAANAQYYMKVTGTTADDDACDAVVTGFNLTVTRKRG
ncbi:MAG: hypothetical protein PHQ43_04875 [Dehalococcoidales bacterium]|jgi:hypothetical protein|nr:hypothetical protein [Dehalococcoidales bacterium]